MNAVLVVAGCDSSGGAGVVRDVATLTRLGVQARCAVTALTVQTDARFIASHTVDAALVVAQIRAAGEYQAVKIGMLAEASVVRAVAANLAPRARRPVVLDPVLASSSGGSLLTAEGIAALREGLLTNTTLLTPNIPEAALLLGLEPAHDEATLLAQAGALLRLGPAAVLIKGGHAQGDMARDLLLQAGQPPHWFSSPRLAAQLRGSGCALASAVAAGLAAGVPLVAACQRAKEHVSALLREA